MENFNLDLDLTLLPNFSKLVAKRDYVMALLKAVDGFLWVHCEGNFTGLTTQQMEVLSKLCSGESNQSQLSNIEASLTSLTDAMKVSSRKGALAENMLESIITSHFFDEIVVENTAHRDHEADLMLTTDEGQKILLESKFYTAAVGQTQINKFLNDVERTGVHYAIFASLSSAIVHKKRVQYELHGNCHVLYISTNSAADTTSLPYVVIISIIFMKNLFRVENKHNLDAMFIEKKCECIMNSGREFEDAFNDVTKLRLDVGKMKDEVCASIDRIYRTLLQLEHRMRTLVDCLNASVKEQLQDIVDAATSDDNACATFIASLKATEDPLYASYLALIDVMTRQGITIRVCKNGKLLLLMNEDIIAEVKRLKKKIDVVFVHLYCTVEFNAQSSTWIEQIIDDIKSKTIRVLSNMA